MSLSQKRLHNAKFPYLLPEIIQFVSGTRASRAVRFLQLESLHAVRRESIDRDLRIAEASICEQAAGPLVTCQRPPEVHVIVVEDTYIC